MNSASNMIFHDLVLVGGGHAHVHVLKMLGMQPIPHVRVTLITRDVATPYSGMIPGYIAGVYDHDECHLDLFRMSVFANVKLIHAEVKRLDTEKKLIYCADGRPPIRYDTLSIDVGIVPCCPEALRDHPHVTPVKPIDRFASRWERFLAKQQARLTTVTPIRILIVGGGAGGVEISFSIDQRLKDLGIAANIAVVNRGEKLMTSHGQQVQDMIAQTLTQRNIEVISNTEIVAAENDATTNQHYLVTADGRRLPFDEAFWCTQAKAHSWLQDSGLALDPEGFILVSGTLQSVNRNGVFAAGDCCHNVDHPRPKAGVFAVRAGPPLYRNLRRTVLRRHSGSSAVKEGEELEVWVPQSEFLGLIGTADGSAIATKAGMALQGDFLWELKDKIDRVWMKQYSDLPVMDPKKKPEAAQSTDQFVLDAAQQVLMEKAKMRCAGCGSKVGSTVLSRALARLKKYRQQRLQSTGQLALKQRLEERVVLGIGDDAAVVKWSHDALVQTIDYFKSFVADPYLFGQIAANHALSDLHAMGAKPVSALVLCTLPYATETVTEDELLHVLSGIQQVLDEEDCALIGGHSSEGSELAVGLAVTGYLPSTVLPKGPVLPDHVILLTKAIGTGVLLAGAMPHRNYVSGREIRVCYESMRQSNARAAHVLLQQMQTNATAVCIGCTDVTGFGLLGHLIEMVRYNPKKEGDNEEEQDDEDFCRLVSPSEFIVRLSLSSIPLLPGALACSQEHQVVSSLFGANHRSAQEIINLDDAQVTAHPVYPLLFDPQTSGGLLLCVRQDQADDVVQALKESGYAQTAVIGRVERRSEETHLRGGTGSILLEL